MIDPEFAHPAIGTDRVLGKVLTDRDPEWPELRAGAEVGLHQRTDGVLMASYLYLAGAGSGAALEFIGRIAGAAAYVAFLYRPASGATQCLQRMVLLDVAPADVIHQSVVGFRHHRHGPGIVLEVLLVLLDHPSHSGVMHDTDRVGVGETDGTYEITGILDPMCAGHLAVAVEGVLSCPDWQGFAAVSARQDGGNTGVDLALPGSARQ